MSRLFRCTVALPALLIVGACASAQPRIAMSPLLPAGFQPAPEQKCQVMESPAVLPDAAVLVDVAAAQRALQSAAAPVVLELMFDSVGVQQRVRVVEGAAERAAERALVDAVVARIPDPTGRSVSVLLRGEPGGALTVGRMEYCACALVNREEFTALVISTVKEARLPIYGMRQLVLDVRSDSTGKVIERRLAQSTGSLELDRLLFELTPRLQVAAPLLNRRPLDAWSRLPININFTRGGTAR